MPKSALETEAKSGRTRRVLAVVAVVVLLAIVAFASPFALAMYGNAADHECGKTPHFDGSDPAARYDTWAARWSWTEPGWVCVYYEDGEIAEEIDLGLFP